MQKENEANNLLEQNDLGLWIYVAWHLHEDFDSQKIIEINLD